MRRVIPCQTTRMTERSGPTTDGLMYLSLPRYTVGLVVRGGRVVDAPPIAVEWTLGRDARQVWREAARRGARLVWIPHSV